MKPLNIEKVKEHIAQTSPQTGIYVGCDSRRFKSKSKWYATYARLVLVHIDSCKGVKIYGDVITLPDWGQTKARLMQEVYFATEIAQAIAETVGERPFEVHLDINPNPLHKSNTAMKEAMGYVRGMLGIEAKLKPHATAASTAADLFTGKAPLYERDFSC